MPKVSQPRSGEFQEWNSNRRFQTLSPLLSPLVEQLAEKTLWGGFSGLVLCLSEHKGPGGRWDICSRGCEKRLLSCRNSETRVPPPDLSGWPGHGAPVSTQQHTAHLPIHSGFEKTSARRPTSWPPKGRALSYNASAWRSYVLPEKRKKVKMEGVSGPEMTFLTSLLALAFLQTSPW